MTNFPNGLSARDWDHIEGRHMNDSEPRGFRSSRTTGEYGESSEFVRELGARAFAAMPAHRTMVLSISEHRWGAWCKSCAYEHTPGAIGNNKEAIEALALAHELENAR